MPVPLTATSFAGPWTGVNDSSDPFKLDDGEFLDALNVTTSHGSIEKCRGTLIYGDLVASATTVWCAGYDYVKRSGTRYHLRIVTIGANTALQYYNAGAWTTIGAGTEFGAYLPTFVTWPTNDLLFIADKSGTIRKKWTGGGFTAPYLTDWGIAVPASAATAASNLNGSKTAAATYLFKYTYYNSTTTEESNPSASVSQVIAADPNDGVTLTIPQLASWATQQFDKVRIYSTTAGGSTYYLEETINADGTTYADPNTLATGTITSHCILSDAALTAGNTLLETDNDQPVGMKYIVSHKGRIFGAGNTTNPHILYYSKIGEPENWPTANALDTKNPSATAGPQDIMGLFVQDDQLHILTLDQHIVLRGTDESDFILEWLPHGAGTVSHHSIVQWDRYTRWESLSGPCVWDGSSHTFPGQEKLENTWGNMAMDSTDWTNAGSPNCVSPDYLGNIVSCIQKAPGRFSVLTSYTRRGQTSNDRIQVHDLTNDSFHFRSIAAASFGIVKGSNNVDVVYVGDYGGRTLTYDKGFTFNGSAISAYAQTKWFPLGSPEKRKRLRGIAVSLREKDPSLAAHNVTISWYLDFSTTAAGSKLIAVPSSRAKPIFFPIAVQAQFVSFRIANANASEDFALDAFTVYERELTAVRESVA